MNQPGTSVVWTKLSRILNMGGTWEEDNGARCFCMPYTQSNKTFEKFDYNFDWYTTAVCILEKVPVYKSPNIRSEIVATLNYDVVEIDAEKSSTQFTKINSIDHSITGYVKQEALEFSAEYSLWLKKIDGQWKIISYAPYD